MNEAATIDRQQTPRQSAKAWVPKFLASFKRHGNISAAALDAGISRDRIYRRRQRSATFAKAMDDAFEQSVDVLEATAFQRATREKSDAVLMFLLRAKRPGIFKHIMGNTENGNGTGTTAAPSTVIAIESSIPRPVRALSASPVILAERVREADPPAVPPPPPAQEAERDLGIS